MGPSASVDTELVPFFTQAETFAGLWPLISHNIDEVIRNGSCSLGPMVAELESALAAYTGAGHVVALNSGTDALVLLLRAAGLRRWDQVVLPAFSSMASASAVVLAGGRPVFADIEPATYTLDAESVAAVVTPRSRIVLPAHLFCQPADLAAIREVADEHDMAVVEDSAAAIGMRWGGVHAGLVGIGGVLSFYPTETLGAIGDAGAVLTHDPHLAETVAALRRHGRVRPTADTVRPTTTSTQLVGVNSRMDDLQAAVLLAKLTRLDADIARRELLAEAYTERLTGRPGVLRLPTVVRRGVPTRPVYHAYVIEVERRDQLAAHLAAVGIGTEPYYPLPLHLQPCFAALGYWRGEFPHAEAACERTIALPLYPDLTVAHLDRVCAAIDDFYLGRPA